MRLFWILPVLLLAMTGCAGSTGWRFEIGISPVKQLDNRAGLSQTEKKDGEKNGKF